MQETGSNIEASLNRILSIRLAPSGLYYSITKSGKLETLDKIRLASTDVTAELKSIFGGAYSDFTQNFDVVNVVVDKSEVLLVPEELVGMADVDSAKEILKINSIVVADGSEVVITGAVRGVRALFMLDRDLIDIFTARFSDVKFSATILSDVLMESNSIRVTINEMATSISCRVEGDLLYADVMPSDLDATTIVYYIQSLVSQFTKKGAAISTYISGSKCQELLAHISSIMPVIQDSACVGCSTFGQRRDIVSYNDLIRLSSENN